MFLTHTEQPYGYMSALQITQLGCSTVTQILDIFVTYSCLDSQEVNALSTHQCGWGSIPGLGK